MTTRCLLVAAVLLALSHAASAQIPSQARADAGAGQREAFIRSLENTDAQHRPEVEDTLIFGLRGDPSEAVRYEAAIVLGTGCCCTKKTIAALLIAASGTSVDQQ